MEFSILPARLQNRFPQTAYDQWMTPQGEILAEFYRNNAGFLVRFPERGDFEIDALSHSVRCWPSPGIDEAHVRSIFDNSIVPALGNHRGGLFLHGSAVGINGHGAAFLGHSRSGKTTLASAFAKQGFAMLTQDVIELDVSTAQYRVRPNTSPVRLFADSAAFVLGHPTSSEDDGVKVSLQPTGQLRFATADTPLLAIFILGADFSSDLAIHRLDQKGALAAVLPHSFVLDVEDKARLNSHFNRLADLTQRVPCFTLDYERHYAKLPDVIATVSDSFARLEDQ
ncbi:MAG: hypothetical protein AAGL10_15305 [Pseudomonadota bacterium]